MYSEIWSVTRREPWEELVVLADHPSHGEADEELGSETEVESGDHAGDGARVFISSHKKNYVHAHKVNEFFKSHNVLSFFSEESLPREGDADCRRQIDYALEQCCQKLWKECNIRLSPSGGGICHL